MPEVTVFSTRFGGQVSLEQELTDMTKEFPPIIRPVWKIVLAFLLPFIKKVKIERTIRKMDEQAVTIREHWEEFDRASAVSTAVLEAQERHPNAHVESVAMPDHPMDAVYIEHPPEPGNKAQELLGFSSIEIKAPFVK